ncbi:permease, partial [Lysinibacillus halotolerans]
MSYSQKSSFNLSTIIFLLLVVGFIFFSPFFVTEEWSSLPQLNTIFLSILIEAIPFVLIGVLIAGFIQIFITEEHIKSWIPKSKVKAVFMS